MTGLQSPQLAARAAALAALAALALGLGTAGQAEVSTGSALAAPQAAGTSGPQFTPSAGALAFEQAFADLPAPINQTATLPHAVDVTEVAAPVTTAGPAPDTAPDTAGTTPAARHLGSGMASFYADRFHGQRTASGEAFDQRAMTAAHRTLPFGSLVRVTNPATGASVVVRINDRGPFTRGRTIDVSRAAAEELGLVRAGHGHVELALLEG